MKVQSSFTVFDDIDVKRKVGILTHAAVTDR